jgi:hypothetical protein
MDNKPWQEKYAAPYKASPEYQLVEVSLSREELWDLLGEVNLDMEISIGILDQKGGVLANRIKRLQRLNVIREKLDAATYEWEETYGEGGESPSM